MARSNFVFSLFGKVFIYIVVGMMVLGALAVAAVIPVQAANPSATITQYANDPPVNWVTGNLGASKSTYYEGDTIPYRIHLSNMTAGPHSLVIEWDTTKAGYHSLDYITGYNNTVTPNPCLGLSASICTLPVNTFPIPADTQVTAEGVIPIPGVFTLYGGTITGVSAYSYPDGSGYLGDKSAQITLSFTVPANVPDLVLAWGGHISTREDWGFDRSAIMISGSPYHMRLIGLDGSGGNQDLSLSASATEPDAVINKICVPAVYNQDFPYYRVVVTNAGPGSVYGAKITDTLPVGAVPTGTYSANLTVGGVTSPGGTCTFAGQLVTCELLEWIPSFTIDATAKWVVDVHFSFTSQNYEDYVNTANLSTLTVDNTPANNTSTAVCEFPQAVNLLGFNAVAGQGRTVTLGWETSTEVNNLGFNLYRSASLEGAKTKVNNQLIRSLLPPGSQVGAVYQYVDTVPAGNSAAAGSASKILRQAKNGERWYYYWLESVDIYGLTGLHGPVEVLTKNK